MSTKATQPRREGLSSPYAFPIAALFVLAYVLTALAGLRLAYYQQNATLIWAPSGLAIAALWRYGWRFAPAVFIAALIANVAVGTHVGLAALIAVGNTAEAASPISSRGAPGFVTASGGCATCRRFSH